MRKSNYILEKNRFRNAFVKNNLHKALFQLTSFNHSGLNINYEKNYFRDLVFWKYCIALYSTIDTSVHFNKQVTRIIKETVD